ncbi:MAG: hypothetical protein WC799_03800 [Desulfobacteraceae bacterium]|jgi:hypothetical protein
MDDMIEGLTKEISNNIREMSRCTDLDKKKKHAEIIKLLCDSIGVFFEGMNMVDYDMLDDMDDMDDMDTPDDFYHDDIVDFKSIKKNRKKKNKNDIPF